MTVTNINNNNNIYYTIISTQLDIINKQDMFYCFLSL